MTEVEFKRKTKRLALAIIGLVETLPRSMTAQVIGKQLVRCATSVGANYRAACRGKSPADMLMKLTIVEEESDEAIYWLELLTEANIASEDKTRPLRDEMNEIVAMTVASIKTIRARSHSAASNPKSKI